MQSIISHFVQRPRSLFLLDAAGALLSAGSIFLLPTLLPYGFGLPRQLLMALVIIALVLAAYDLICILLARNNWPPFLLGTICLNTFYSLSTMAVLIVHWKDLTHFGAIYLLLELGVLLVLMGFEYRVWLRGKTRAAGR